MLEIPSADKPLVAIDIETTGLHPFFSEILEVAAVEFKLDGTVTCEFSELVNPSKPIPARATEIHGITEDMVKDKPVWFDVAPRLYDFVKDSILVAHNSPFDLGFLKFKGTVIAMPFPELYVADTLTISREIFADFQRHTLVDLAATLEIPLENAHRALADAKACASLFRISFFKANIPWDEFANQYIVHTAAWQTLDNIPEGMMPLVEACREGHEISIVYIDSEGEVTSRRIMPLQLNRIRQTPYLFGHCYLRDAGRNFRLDRIQTWEKV